MGAAWLVVAAAPGPLAWVAVAAPFGLATAFARPAILGALAEIGRRRAATGRLAAAHVSLAQLAELVLLPATLPMALTSLWLPAGVAAGLALAVVVLIVALSSGEMPAPGMPPPAVVGIPRFLRSRAFWTSTAVLACAGLATVPQTLLWPQLRAADGGPIGSWALRWTMPASTGAGALVYLVTCRRLPFAGLLRVALLVKAGTLAVQALTATNLAAGTVDLVLHARAVADGLAAAAVLDLVLRAAPRGREAFGSILLLGVSGVLTALVASLATSLSAVTALSLGGMAWFATCAASAGAIAVWLLPASIVELRESRRGHRERRMIGSPP